MDGGVVAFDVKAIFEALLAREVEGLLDVLVIGVEAQDARDECTIGAVAAVGVGEGVPQAKGDFGDAPSSRLAATWAQRRAPAVCDELGPTMTGPKISNAEVVASVCGLPAMDAPYLSRRPEGRDILCPAVPRALVFGRLLGQSCSHGGHIKWPPARAELAIDQILKPSELRIHGWSRSAAKFIGL